MDDNPPRDEIRPAEPLPDIVSVVLSYEFGGRADRPAAEHLVNPLFRTLAAVRAEGSIAAAARRLGHSYRHLWGYLKKQEDRFGRPLLQWDQGRAARLTDFAERLLWAEARIRARLAPQIENLATEIGRELTAALDDTIATAVLVASHDLALPGLRELCRDAGLQLDLRFAGSVDALLALKAGQCGFAGIHLPADRPELAARGTVPHRAFGPLLRKGREKLIRVSRRRQGLFVAPGNPLGIAGIGDLTRVRFVNRAEGAGTRVVLEQLLAERAIDPSTIRGHDRVEATHLAVATAVASGEADTGFGIEAAARQCGLDFVPLLEEDYYLACEATVVDSPVAHSLRKVLAGDPWRAHLEGLPGYSAVGTGEVVSLRETLPWYR